MEPFFKIGDYVKVLPRTKESGAYRCGFANDMTELQGQVFQVTDVHEHGHPRQQFIVPDDGYVYTLDGEADDCSWSSGMLELFKSEEPKEKKATFSVGDVVEILPRKGSPEDYTNPYVTPMESYVGRYAVIKSIQRPSRPSTKEDDGYAYCLDIDNAKFQWASSMLEKHSPLFHRSKECVQEIKEVLKPKPKDKARYKLNFNI